MTKKGIFARIGDSMQSMLTSLGNKSAKRTHRRGRELRPDYLWTLYSSSSWVVKKYIDKTARDMVKKWREIRSNDFTPDELAAFSKEEKNLKVQEVAEEALSWASLFGDVLVLAITDISEAEYSRELVLENEEIKRFLVIDRRAFLLGDDLDKDITSENFGNPTTYIIKGKNDLVVHHTRVCRLRAGKRLFSDAIKNRYGVSDINAIYSVISMFDTITTSVADLTEESKVDVLAIDGLNEQISAGKEEDVLKYAAVASQSKSQSNMLLIDKQTTYEQKEVSFAGLSDIWVKAGNVLAGALDRTLSILFGQSANGFSSGEEDNQVYFDTINGLQESRLRIILDFIDVFIFDRMGKAPEDWEYEFPTLDVINRLEEAQTFAAYVAALIEALKEGVITEVQVSKELKQRGLMLNITDEDITKLENLILEASNEPEPDFREEAQAA